jgi:hypothetical protein
MQFDQVYLYKFALMLAIQDIVEGKPFIGKFQDIWNWYIENAGDYIINKRVPERQKTTNE